jgi:hypothetical protein
MKTEMWTWMRVQFFRFWTALVVLGAYGYFWLNTPEYLTWWKRTVNTLIEKGCDMLSYPWGDRIESTVGNFGIWVQITLAAGAVFSFTVPRHRCPAHRRAAHKPWQPLP